MSLRRDNAITSLRQTISQISQTRPRKIYRIVYKVPSGRARLAFVLVCIRTGTCAWKLVRNGLYKKDRWLFASIRHTLSLFVKRSFQTSLTSLLATSISFAVYMRICGPSASNCLLNSWQTITKTRLGQSALHILAFFHSAQ